MVVLEGASMLPTGGNQYLQPDYLSPLPTTLDAKKSPLALLAQTCSQIGADSPPSKPIVSAQDKKKSSSSAFASRTTPPNKQQQQQQADKPAEIRHLAFKPYETNVLTKKSDDPRPSSKASTDSSDDRKSASGKVTPGRKSGTPAGSSSLDNAEKASPSASGRKTSSPAGSSTRGASPIIRSGLEVLQAHSKPLGLCCPPGLEQHHHNPAFRPPFAGLPHHPHHAHHHHQQLYPGSSPYLGYARVKTPAGGEALVPVCKDPYCTGCQLSLHGHQSALLAAAAAASAAAMPPCPAGCTQCDHHKYSLAVAMGALPPYAAAQLAAAGGVRPYVCNWIAAGDSYCGKRFSTSDELLQHLRGHTAESGGGGAQPSVAQLSPPPAGGGGGGFLSPALARFHPYAKPGALAPPLGAPYSPFGPAALAPYYSPYAALYGQRLGAAHQ